MLCFIKSFSNSNAGAPIGIPNALASLDLAITQLSLLDNTTIGLSFNEGLAISNQVGVIDSDYVQEIFISLVNLSNSPKRIIHNQRIAQGELVVHQSYRICEAVEKPEFTSNRVGGFGSTGK